MKKYICIALVFMLVFLSEACGQQAPEPAQTNDNLSMPIPTPIDTPSPVYSDPELARAVAIGIGSYAQDDTVTYEQFFDMLDNAVKMADSSVLAVWESQFLDARVSKKTMKREDGMLAVFYAAQALGGEYVNTNYNWVQLNETIGDTVWDDFSMNYPLFPHWDQPTEFDGGQWPDARVSAYFYSMSRVSVFSEKLVFDYDPDKNSMRPSDPLTYTEALLAALRLYDSVLQITDRVPTEEDAAILKMADERRNAILNSETNITVTGTSYYVSNSGDDCNDGKTPETAWATTNKVNHTEFKPGDAVFFERGGVFRGILWYKSDITYSAYGTGPKPRIYGSPENGAESEKWTLLEGTDNIWVFYEDMYDTGGIVFNEGESWATRRTAIWNGQEYVDLIDNTLIDVTKLDNLHFFSAPDYTGYSLEEAGPHLSKGKLYLRCDAGNPGQVYQSIEFLSNEPSNVGGIFIIQTGPNSVIDNLCLMYGNGGGVSVVSNCIVQNCEVAWIGGTISGFSGSWVGVNQAAVIRCGDGILLAQGTNSVVVNNYVHHLYDFGINVETGAWFSTKDRYAYNMAIKDNLVERCSGGSNIADYEALYRRNDSNLIFDNISITNNYYLYMGYGWSHLTPDYDWGQAGEINNGNCSLMLNFPAKASKNIVVENNVFYLSRYALIWGASDGQTQEFPASFSGNAYVQNNMGLLAEWPLKADYSYQDKTYYNLVAKQSISKMLGDDSAITLMPSLDMQ